MLISQLLYLILFIFNLQEANNSSPYTQHEIGYKIGYVKNGKNVISIDSTEFKQQWEKILPIPDVKLDKIEIRKDLTLGGKEEAFYMLIAYDRDKSLKTARWLVRDGDSFYFYKSPPDESNPDHVFFRSYFTCNGTDDDCGPHVFFLDNRYHWACSDKYYCDPNSPCKGSTMFFPVE